MLLTIKFGVKIAGPHLKHSFMCSAKKTAIQVIEHISISYAIHPLSRLNLRSYLVKNTAGAHNEPSKKYKNTMITHWRTCYEQWWTKHTNFHELPRVLLIIVFKICSTTLIGVSRLKSCFKWKVVWHWKVLDMFKTFTTTPNNMLSAKFKSKLRVLPIRIRIKHDVKRSWSKVWKIQKFFPHLDQIDRHQHRQSLWVAWGSTSCQDMFYNLNRSFPR